MKFFSKLSKYDKVLLSLSAFFVLFVAAVLVVFVLTDGNEPTALVSIVGGAIIAEILALAKLKLDKRHREALKEAKKDCESEK